VSRDKRKFPAFTQPREYAMLSVPLVAAHRRCTA